MKSKFWDKMEVLRFRGSFIKQKIMDTDDAFITTERPAFFANKESYTILKSSEHKYNEHELGEISKLYNKYRIGDSLYYNLVTLDDLKRYLKVGGEIVTVYVDNKLVGCMISFALFETEIKTTKKINLRKGLKLPSSCACSSYLILDERYRGKGLGMALIQESLQKLYDIGGTWAYFLNGQKRCDNAIKFKRWCFPLNFPNLDACGVKYLRNHTSVIDEHLKTSQMGQVSQVNCEEDIKKSYSFYMANVKGDIVFTPDEKKWKEWISCFPTYIVEKDGEIKSVISLNRELLYYPMDKKFLRVCSVLIFLGVSIGEILSHERDHSDIIYTYSNGFLDEGFLKRNYFEHITDRYLNFYNLKILTDSKNFSLPLL